MKKLTKDFNAVSLTKKEVFQVELPAAPSAGYLWSTVIRAGEGRLLSQQMRSGNDLSSSALSVGAGMTQIFTFVADAPGTLIIDAVYQRPWEKQPAETRTFTISVK